MAALAWPFRKRLLLGGLLMIGESASLLALPWAAARFATSWSSTEAPWVAGLALLLLAVIAFQTGFRIANRRTLAVATERLVAHLSLMLHRHLVHLRMVDFSQRTHGEYLALVTSEARYLGQFLASTIISLVPMLLLAAGSILIMASLNWVLTLPVAAGICLFFVVMKLSHRRLRLLATEMKQAHAAAVSVAEENVSTFPAVKIFGREAHEAGRFRIQVARYQAAAERLVVAQSSLGPAMHLFTAGGLVLIILWQGAGISGEAMDLREMIAFLLYAAVLAAPLSRLADSWGELQHARMAVDRIDRFLASQTENLEQGSAPATVRGEVRFDKVSFAYAERPPTLLDLDLQIRAGETVAITGENGAGKSTLAALLLRLYDPDAGRIFLDDQDLSTLKLSALRQAIGFVPQNVYLFAGSIADNIAVGNPSADPIALREASIVAQTDEFIRRLPEGYTTQIGEGGIRLSGGERQRLALARALIRKPAVLMLDEPTAMFDPEAERQFVLQCREALRAMTVILITHRPASLELADRVVHLRDGKMLE